MTKEKADEDAMVISNKTMMTNRTKHKYTQIKEAVKRNQGNEEYIRFLANYDNDDDVILAVVVCDAGTSYSD